MHVLNEREGAVCASSLTLYLALRDALAHTAGMEPLSPEESAEILHLADRLSVPDERQVTMTVMTFPVPHCRCGHPTGSHKSIGSRFPHPTRYGVCMAPDCGCREYQERTEQDTADVLLDAAEAPAGDRDE